MTSSLLASSNIDFKLALVQFAAKCEASGLKISSSKFEAMVLSRVRDECPLWFGKESLFQVAVC